MGIKSTNRRPPSAQISISISQLLYIASAWPGERESFSGIVRSNLEVCARSGRNYHADCPVPPRCYGAPPKCGLNQSMAPFFGTLWYTRALYGATPSAKATKFAAQGASSQYGIAVNAHYLSSESVAIISGYFAKNH